MKIRRVVTGHAGKKAVVISDGPSPKAFEHVHTPGGAITIAWATEAAPSVPHRGGDAVSAGTSFVPKPGESRMLVVTFPPDSVRTSASFNPAAARAEYAEKMPDLAAKFEPDAPGMHTSDSIDYGVVLEGEIWLELDDGKLVHLKPHDIVIQNGTRHAWRNKSDRPAKLAFVLIGATRSA